MYEQYIQICAELGLIPLSEESITHEGPQEISEYNITQDGVVVACFAKPINYKSPCQDCFEVKHGLANNSYEPTNSLEPIDGWAIILTRAMAQHHGIPFACSSLFPDQPWSVVFPLLDCDCLNDINIQDRDSRFDWQYALNVIHNRDVVHQQEPLVRERTAGARRLSPDTFVRLHRHAVGFASILGNPAYETDGLVHLVSGPIFTSSSDDQLEVAGGKGFSLQQAGASWMGEGLERYYLTGSHLSLSQGVQIREDDWTESPFFKKFGLPAYAPDGAEIKQNNNSWTVVECEDLTAGGTVELPSSLIWCPDVPSVYPTISPTQSSTNGAAAGATVEDASLQGLLELIERDAFWFHLRTGSPVCPMDPASAPGDIARFITSETEGEYFIHRIPTPFPLYVVQVTYVRSDTHGGALSRTARGTGTSHSLGDATSRAFAECRQMLSSLDTGKDIEFNLFDMREAWFTGSSLQHFENFFVRHSEPAAGEEHQVSSHSYPEPTLESLVRCAENQGITLYRKVLKRDEAISIVKIVGSLVNVVDPTKYANNGRFVYLGKYLGCDVIDTKYSGSTFM